ncbi:hypothetical protein RB213_011367 [Colletotrichum asianum]
MAKLGRCHGVDWHLLQCYTSKLDLVARCRLTHSTMPNTWRAKDVCCDRSIDAVTAEHFVECSNRRSVPSGLREATDRNGGADRPRRLRTGWLTETDRAGRKPTGLTWATPKKEPKTRGKRCTKRTDRSGPLDPLLRFF